MNGARIPLFPLSNVVLFPGCLAPLHVFEPRYRQMTEQALEGERIVGMIAVEPRAIGEMAGDPALYAVGCAGFITDQERLADGRFNIVLRGTQCFRLLREIPRDADRLYRLADVELLEEPAPAPRPDLRRSVAERLTRLALRSGGGPGIAFDRLESLDDGAFANVLCQAIGFPPEEKQGLLEAGVEGARLERLDGLLAFHLAALEGPNPGDAGIVH